MNEWWEDFRDQDFPKTILSQSLNIRGTYVLIRWLVEPRDLWIGVYWNRYPSALDLFICVLPALPVNIYIQMKFGEPR